MEFNQLIDEVGKLDKLQLKQLSEYINERFKAIRAEKLAATKALLTVGQMVGTSGLRPKALNGLTGEVVNIKQTRADVKITSHVPFSASRYINLDTNVLKGVPISCLTLSYLP
jgi:hypothetical protein